MVIKVKAKKCLFKRYYHLVFLKAHPEFMPAAGNGELAAHAQISLFISIDVEQRDPFMCSKSLRSLWLAQTQDELLEKMRWEYPFNFDQPIQCYFIHKSHTRVLKPITKEL